MRSRKPFKKRLATTVFAAGMLIGNNTALAHETGPDADHEHSTEEEQDTPEHTDLCIEVIPTDGWEEFDSESSHIYSGAFDQYSDEMQAMMRVRGTYEECELLLEPVRRRNIQEWLVGDGEDGFWVSKCEGDSNLPSGFQHYSLFYGGVWQNGKPALNPELCQRVTDLLNETSGGLGNNAIWRARIAALVEDALSSRCATDTENGYDLKTCRQSATSANTILNCLDSIIESLPEDKDEAQEMIHDQLFGITTEEGWTPSDNSGLCRPSSGVQPIHGHEGQEPHFDDGGHEETEPESAQANSEDELETAQANSEDDSQTTQQTVAETLAKNQVNSEDDSQTTQQTVAETLAKNQVNSEDDSQTTQQTVAETLAKNQVNSEDEKELETAQTNSEEELETAQVNSEDEKELETAQTNSEEELETAQVNSEDEKELETVQANQANSEEELETAQVNSEEELETAQVNSEDEKELETAQTNSEEELETAQVNSEDEKELETAQTNSEEELETAQVNSEDEKELETAQTNSEEELETAQVNSEDEKELETAQTNSEEELETAQVNSEEDDSQTTQQTVAETLAKMDIPDNLRIVFQGAINAYHARGCTATIREIPRPRIVVDCS